MTDQVGALPSQPFHEPARFPYLSALVERWRDVRDELLQAAAQGVQYTPRRDDIVGPASQWTQFELFVCGLPLPTNVALAPITMDLLGSVPNLLQAAVYGLGPGSHIEPHAANDPQRLRAHLGLRCPAGSRLRVDNETRDERDGGLLIFDDNFEHEAWNRSSEFRYVLHVDFVKPGLPALTAAELEHRRSAMARGAPDFLPLAIFAGMKIGASIRQEIRDRATSEPEASDYSVDVWAAYQRWLHEDSRT